MNDYEDSKYPSLCDRKGCKLGGQYRVEYCGQRMTLCHVHVSTYKWSKQWVVTEREPRHTKYWLKRKGRSK